MGKHSVKLPYKKTTSAKATAGAIALAAFGTAFQYNVASAQPAPEPTVDLDSNTAYYPLPSGNKEDGVSHDHSTYDPATMDPNRAEAPGAGSSAAWLEWEAAGRPGYEEDTGGSKGVEHNHDDDVPEAPADPVLLPPTAHDWSGVADCESGGDWDYYEEGHPYSGGLQFSPTTWDLYGGQEFAPFAHLATPEEQQIVAERVLNGWNGTAGQGVGAWPTCGQFLAERGYTPPPPAPSVDLGAPCSDHGVSFSELNMIPNAVRMARAICALFGNELSIIGGWRQDGYEDHPSGSSIDVMVSNLELGDRINNWVRAHAAEYNLRYVLYKQIQWNPDGSYSGMSDRGSATQNHFDHLHIRVW